MTKPELLKKFSEMVDEFERGRVWGTIEVQFGDGKPGILRKSTTEKLDTTENNRARFNSR